MGFVDGAGGTTLGAINGRGAAVVGAVGVSNVSPTDAGRSFPVELRVFVSNSHGVNSDVQFEVSTSSTFGTTVFSTTVTNQPDGFVACVPTGLSVGATYYWRARAADTGTTAWAGWSGTMTPTYTAVSTSGATKTASSEYSSAWQAVYAFDGQGGDGNVSWASGVGLPQWLKVQFPAAQTVGHYEIWSRAGDQSSGLKTWTFEGSNDGTTWTVLDTQTNAPIWPNSQKRGYGVGTPGSYVYYRLNVTAVQGGSLASISELVLHGPAAYAPVPWSFVVDNGPAKGIAYAYQNVGFEPGQSKSIGPEYVLENIGFLALSSRVGPEYVLENVGFQLTPSKVGAEYVYEGDVNTATPSPHVWFLRPTAGRPGDAIEIFCFGVGDIASQYGGVVEIYMGPLPGWQPVNVVAWQTFPPTPDAYGPLRMIDQALGELNVQHTVVQISVPSDALPPGYPVRIRTEGP